MGSDELILPEHEAQAVVLVRALEETDRAGRILSHGERRQATAAAREAGGREVADWLGRRARELVAALGRQLPALPRLLRLSRPLSGWTLPALVLAFVAGLATNALGPTRRISVLAVPLLAIVAWNLAVLCLLAVRRWLPFGALVPEAVPRLLEALQGLMQRALNRQSADAVRRLASRRRPADRTPEPEESEGELVRRTLARYAADWFAAALPLASARLRLLLHATSLALILGVVAGMYLRGLVLEYRVSWESTFLSSAAIDLFLGAVLGPAAAVLSVEVPSVAGTEFAPHGDAAPWIHLYATTAALFVALPRLALTAAGWLRCRRLARRVALEIPDAYPRRLATAAGTSEHRVEVWPYSHRPAHRSFAALKELLLDLFGPRTEVRLMDTLTYGSEVGGLEGGGRCRIVLFSLAQTPEVEVHGHLLRALRDRLADGQALLVLVDGSVYRERLLGGRRPPPGEDLDAAVERRLAERRRSWGRVVSSAGLETVHVDLQALDPERELARWIEAAWPPGALAEEP